MTHRSLAHAEQVHHLFDEKAASWPAHYASNGRLLSRLRHFAGIVADLTSSGSAVLDLGCGTGELARQLARSGFQVTACDVSGKMLAQARETDTGHRASWVRLDSAWQILPFATGSFSTVVAASVLEYVEAPGQVFAECARILQPGGILLCTVPNLAHPVRWLELAAQRVARSPLGRNLAVIRSWSRMDSYLAYLTLSKQRKRTSQWVADASQAGLQIVPFPVKTAGQPTLRLLIFRQAALMES